ncbi:tetratricopeptide repeat protein [Candidatus Venteria ishoeyi]|uniref:Photosystem I assembly protein Ycf3 n=1 Tax=Candidatus Venteria ishoeyi TaxID=1899563 RepID=A0A1H6F8E5_9GAMM|nr:tetratricopeptide repeat protein [Candidatus Venteria ishoeyi]SEH05681.1 photosystem I assembly protein Ycf3 [Candidatus Venteria ishoeyi]
MNNQSYVHILLSLLLLSLSITLFAAQPDREIHRALYKQARQAELNNQPTQALAGYQQALEKSREHWPKDSAAILYLMGGIHLQQQNWAAAIAAYKDSVSLRKQHYGAQHGAVAVSLNGLGGVYAALGDFQQAKKTYEQALHIDTQAFGDKHRKLAVDLNNLAEVARELGDFSTAESYLKQALEIDKQAFGLDSSRIALRFSNLAEIYRQQGQYAEALVLLKKALGIEQKLLEKQEGNAINLGIRLNNLGQLYRTLGQFQKAENYYQQALGIWAKDPGKDSVLYATGLNNRGWIAQALGQPEQAEADYVAAGKILKAAFGDKHPDVAINLNNLALLAIEQQQYQTALPLLEQAQAIWEQHFGKAHAKMAIALHNRAKAHFGLAQYDQAETLLQQALGIANTAGEATVLWTIQDRLAQTLAARQQKNAAILIGKHAVNSLQALRSNLAQMDKELQRSFLEDKADVYRRVAGWLLDQGRHTEASQIQRMLKEEEYFDFVRREQQQEKARVIKASYTPSEQNWTDKAGRFYKRFGKVGSQLRKFRLKPKLEKQEQQAQLKVRGRLKKTLNEFQGHLKDLKTAMQVEEEQIAVARLLASEDKNLVTQAKEFQQLRIKTDLSDAEQQRKTQLRKLINQARIEFNACIGEYKQAKQFADKNLDTLRALQGTLRDLGHGVVLVHYLITPEKLRILLTTPDVQVCRESPVSAEVLNEKIKQYRNLVKAKPDPRRRHLVRFVYKASRELNKWLIAPIAEDLKQAGAKTLMLSLDGRLRYLPISTLFDGKQFLAEKYAVVMFTEAARDKLKDAPTSNWSLAGLGVTKALRDFNALPSVSKELNDIVKEHDQDPQGVIPGMVELNEGFDQDTLQTVLDRGYPVIHIASHFVFQPNTDQDTYLLLGNGEILPLSQVRSEYDFNGVDLLTLSACQTAVGSMTKGQEIEGFGAMAQKQGAKSVMATLWPVDDQGTGAFMEHFYLSHTADSSLTKVDAMQQAQKAFIDARRMAKEQPEQAKYPKDFSHPYYWGPFILMGNWL